MFHAAGRSKGDANGAVKPFHASGCEGVKTRQLKTGFPKGGAQRVASKGSRAVALPQHWARRWSACWLLCKHGAPSCILLAGTGFLMSCCGRRSASKVELPAAVTVAMGAVLASPLASQAGVTPSLKNLINSLVAGGVVLGVIVAAVTAVSGFDPVSRGK